MLVSEWCVSGCSVQALLVGPADTPYEAGCFEFDICLPPEYPNAPPKVSTHSRSCNLSQVQVQLVTTGRGAVRFNANM